MKLKSTEIKAIFNYNALNVWESNGNNYQIQSNNIVSDYRVVGLTSRNNYVFGGGIFHTINEDDYFSFSINGNLKNDDFELKTRTNNLENDNQTSINTLGIANGNRNFINSFLNYNKKINSSWNVFSGLQYSNFNSNSVINSSNNYNETNFQPFQLLDQNFYVNVFTGRIDVEKSLKMR